MSELTTRLQRNLAQAQGFATDAPMEAVARAAAVAREAQAALVTAHGAAREELAPLLELAKRRLQKYEVRVAEWQAENTERAALFLKHERERLQRPIPQKR